MCVRSLTSRWTSDPWLAAELVSVVFAWLRLEHRSSARFTGVTGDVEGGGGGGSGGGGSGLAL